MSAEALVFELLKDQASLVALSVIILGFLWRINNRIIKIELETKDLEKDIHFIRDKTKTIQESLDKLKLQTLEATLSTINLKERFDRSDIGDRGKA